MSYSATYDTYKYPYLCIFTYALIKITVHTYVPPRVPAHALPNI